MHSLSLLYLSLFQDHKIVIGTPGPFTWRGSVFVNSVKFGIRDDKNWYYGPLLDDEAPVAKYSYLGISSLYIFFL